MANCDFCGRSEASVGPLTVDGGRFTHDFHACGECAGMSLEEFFRSAQSIMRNIQIEKSTAAVRDTFELLTRDRAYISKNGLIHFGMKDSLWCNKKRNSLWDTIGWKDVFVHFRVLKVCRSCLKAVTEHMERANFTELHDFARSYYDLDD